eukprot:scaffold48222_cov30-Tisochrysis_lutea.AAC.1
MAARRAERERPASTRQRTSEAKKAVIAASTPSITRTAQRSVGLRIRIGASTQPQRINMSRAAIQLSSAMSFSAAKGAAPSVSRRKLMCDTKVGAALTTTHATRMVKLKSCTLFRRLCSVTKARCRQSCSLSSGRPASSDGTGPTVLSWRRIKRSASGTAAPSTQMAASV